jgi:hypothetical protein
VVGDDLRLPRGAGVKSLVFVVHRLHALVDDPPWAWRRLWIRGAAVVAPTPGSRGALVPALSASVASVVPTLVAVLITSAAEAAGDSTTGVSGALLPKTSCPEALFPLSDVVGGTLLMNRRPK